MKKIILCALSLIMLLALLFAFASCTPPEDTECPPHVDDDANGVCDVCDEVIEPDSKPDFVPDLSGITLNDQSVIYDGNSHSLCIDGTLPEGVTVEYVGNGKIEVGAYEISAKFFYENKELEGKKLTATLTITKATYDMSGVRLLSVTKTYDGIEVTPTLSGVLPDGVSVSFVIKNSLGETVEKMIAADVYTVYATFASDNANYYPIDPISATVKIEAPVISGVGFDDLTVAYDGAAHSIMVEGELPTGVRVVYEGGDKTAVGVYEITAKFYIGDFELVEDRLVATLTITKATIDMSGVSADDCSAPYNGASHAPVLTGNIPSGVEVVYTYSDLTGTTLDKIVAAGSYKVTASFVVNTECYNSINPMTFTFTVEKADFDTDLLYPGSLSKIYDGVAANPSIIGELPSGVEIVYTYKDALGNTVADIIDVGDYTVVASFINEDNNYAEIEPITFVYSVTKATYDISGVKLEAITKTYDGKTVEFSLENLPFGLSANIVMKNSLGDTVSEMVDADTYNVTVIFVGDSTNYYPLDDITTTVVIEKALIGGISFTDAVFNYDGVEKSIFVVGAPDWMKVTYTGNGVVAPGTHTVTASFEDNKNYLPIAPMEAKIVIEIDKNTATSGILFEEYGDGYAVSGASDGATIIVIPDTYNGKPVLSIKSFAFEGNDKLVYVYIPSSVNNIGNKAFSDCTSLANVEFGNINVIGQAAFKNTAIKEISLPESLQTIGFGAFEGTKLEKITLPFIGGSRHSSSAHVGFIFGGTTYVANALKVPSTLKIVVISNGCTSIPPRAFYGLSSLTEVVIGRSVKEIGNSAFQGCSSLRSVYLPSSVTSIPANAKAENGPFFETAVDMMIVLESIDSAAEYGKYFAHIYDGKVALVVYGKTYEDYVMNKDSYRTADPSDATLSGIFVADEFLAGFDSSKYDYTLNIDINAALPTISAIASSSSATVLIENPSLSNGNVATIKVISTNGEETLVYKVKFNVTGTFAPSAEVVNKNGAKGTVTFVVDDGYRPTASFMRSMMEKYSKLAVTYAIYTKNLCTTSDEYKTDNGLIIDDIDNDGIMEYVLDENGKYTYVRNEEAIDFWRDILSIGRSEMVAHSHTHAFWGVNDEGGAQLTASTAGKLSTRIYSTLAEGSATKEVYASIQIVKDIFGDISKSITYVNAGIPPKEGDTTVTEEVKVYLSKQTVRTLYDTKVSVANGKVYLEELTWVNLQSTVGTLPAGTDVTTTVDASSGVIPAGTPIYLASDYVTVPTLDRDGNQNVVKGFKAYTKELYAQALADGTIIGARTSGQKVYVAKDFLDDENRLFRRAYIIATSTNDPEMPASWKNHIDNAISADGGWASFCIHAMTEDINEEGQGGHKITWEQAEKLFEYACSKGDDLWIATQTDATLYYHQWSTSSVTTSYDAEAGAISVSLTDRERDDVYNAALTIKVGVPGNWASATVNGKDLVIKSNSDGSRYVYVDVVPETTISIIGK